jgi:hypothetical protein
MDELAALIGRFENPYTVWVVFALIAAAWLAVYLFAAAERRP